MDEEQARQIVMDMMWTRFFVGEIWIEPTVFDHVFDSEIRQAILQNWHNEGGILIGVHKCRGHYRPEVRFEFARNDPRWGRVADFGEADLDALITAIEAAKLYSSQV